MSWSFGAGPLPRPDLERELERKKAESIAMFADPDEARRSDEQAAVVLGLVPPLLDSGQLGGQGDRFHVWLSGHASANHTGADSMSLSLSREVVQGRTA